MNAIASDYLAAYGTREIAAYALAKDLMRGDKATFKRGYTPANAAIAATETFALNEEQAQELRNDLLHGKIAPDAIDGAVEPMTPAEYGAYVEDEQEAAYAKSLDAETPEGES